MYALKKVRFDTHEPVSVKFMAREIQILRRLDHPNVIKLEGVITSQNSKSIYLVFEYMDHDIAGLIGCNIFSEPQVSYLEIFIYDDDMIDEKPLYNAEMTLLFSGEMLYASVSIWA